MVVLLARSSADHLSAAGLSVPESNVSWAWDSRIALTDGNALPLGVGDLPCRLQPAPDRQVRDDASRQARVILVVGDEGIGSAEAEQEVSRPVGEFTHLGRAAQ